MKSQTKPRIKIRIKNGKRRGEWAELQFIAAAAKHGLQVFNPWGDSSSYDAVIETHGHFVRVQIKSTTSRRPEGCYRCNVHPASGLPYKRGDFDFLAAYVSPKTSGTSSPQDGSSAVKRPQSCSTPPTPPAAGHHIKKTGTNSATTAAART